VGYLKLNFQNLNSNCIMMARWVERLSEFLYSGNLNCHWHWFLRLTLRSLHSHSLDVLKLLRYDTLLNRNKMSRFMEAHLSYATGSGGDLVGLNNAANPNMAAQSGEGQNNSELKFIAIEFWNH
jgi:hypothetical protein